jgi:hypothetical protein
VNQLGSGFEKPRNLTTSFSKNVVQYTKVKRERERDTIGKEGLN